MDMSSTTRVDLSDPVAAQQALIRDVPALGAVVTNLEGKSVEISRGSVLRFRILGGMLSSAKAFPVCATVSFDDDGADILVVPDPGKAVLTYSGIKKKYLSACEDFAGNLEGALALHNS